MYNKNDGEIGLLYDVLNKYKINDIELMYDDKDNLIAMDDDNIWYGKEFYKFMFDEVFNYDNNNIPTLLNEEDFNKLKEYASKYEKEEVELPTEKEKIVMPRSENAQLSLFATKEQEFADVIVDMFNNCSKDTIWENSFEIRKVELEKWEHIKSKKRNLTISLESSNNRK